MNKPTLISLNQELMDLANEREMILVQSEGEITLENESKIKELELRISGLLGQSKDKVSNYCAFLDSIETEINFCDKRIKEVQNYVKRLKNTQDWLLGTAKALIEINKKPLEGNYGNKISLRKSTCLEVTIEPEKLPEGLKRLSISVEADKDAIKEKLKLGEEVDGCKMVDRYSPTWK